MRALRAGACGYLLKGSVHTDLVETIRAVHAGQKRVQAEIAAELAEYTGEDELTARELNVLRLIARGNANKEIAAQPSIADETVKSHITRILDKLRANDRSHVVTIGLERGIIELQTGYPNPSFGWLYAMRDIPTPPLPALATAWSTIHPTRAVPIS